MHPAKPEREYEQVQTKENKALEAEEAMDDNDDANEWSTQETIYANTEKGDTPPKKISKKVLIGNIDEENGMKKPNVRKFIILMF